MSRVIANMMGKGTGITTSLTSAAAKDSPLMLSWRFHVSAAAKPLRVVRR